MGRFGFGLLMMAVGWVGIQFTDSKEDVAKDAFGTTDPVSHVAKGDPAIEAAREKAKANLSQFEAHLRAPEPGEDKFAIKYKLPTSNPGEFVWVSDVAPSPTGFTGKIDVYPRTSGYEIGQQVLVSRSEVTDWGYMRGGVMQGHFTTKVIVEKMPPKQQVAIKQIMGWQ
jgi:uncharacterized protein YegJ (DUF2314 family)